MLNLETIVTSFMLVGLRVTGLFLFAPFFGSASMPIRVKAGFVMLLTWMLAPLVKHSAPISLSTLASFSFREVMVGALLGLSVQLVFEACQLAGQLLGIQFGFSIVRVFDPQSMADSSALALHLQTLALLLWFCMGIPELMLRSLARSYQYVPPGAFQLTGPLMHTLLRAIGGVFLCGIQIAAPALAVTMLIDVALGFLGRVSPQMPVLFIGMSVKTAFGLIVLVAMLPSWPRWFGIAFSEALVRGERMLGIAQ